MSWFNKTADDIVAKFTNTIAELEAHAESKLDEIEEHTLKLLHFEELRDLASEEVNKAEAFAKKLKDLFN